MIMTLIYCILAFSTFLDWLYSDLYITHLLKVLRTRYIIIGVTH